MRRFGSTPSDSLSTPDMRVDDVVHALALERGHRLQPDRLAVLLDLLDRVLGDRGEFLAAVRPVAADVEQQPARRAGLPEDGQPGQLLERLQGGAALADQRSAAGRRPPRPPGGRRRPARRCRRRSRGCRAGPRRSRPRSRSAGTGRPRRRPSSPAAPAAVSVSSSASASSASVVVAVHRERRGRPPRPGTARRGGCWCRSRSHLRTRSAGPSGPLVSRGRREVAGAHGHVCTGSVARGRAARGRFRAGAGRTAAARCGTGRRRSSGGGPVAVSPAAWRARLFFGLSPAWRPASARPTLRRGRP